MAACSTGQCLRFEGSGSDDVQYADTLWHSVQMVPAPEFGLCCSGVKQRLRKAKVGSHSPGVGKPSDLPARTIEFYEQLRAEEELDQFNRLQQRRDRQFSQRNLFQKQKAINQAKAELAKQMQPQQQQQPKPKSSADTNPISLDEAEVVALQ